MMIWRITLANAIDDCGLCIATRMMHHLQLSHYLCVVVVCCWCCYYCCCSCTWAVSRSQPNTVYRSTRIASLHRCSYPMNSTNRHCCCCCCCCQRRYPPSNRDGGGGGCCCRFHRLRSQSTARWGAGTRKQQFLIPRSSNQSEKERNAANDNNTHQMLMTRATHYS